MKKQRLFMLVLVFLLLAKGNIFADVQTGESSENKITLNIHSVIVDYTNTIEDKLLTINGELMISSATIDALIENLPHPIFSVYQDINVKDRFIMRSVTGNKALEFELGSHSYNIRDLDNEIIETGNVILSPEYINGQLYIPFEFFDVLGFEIKVKDQQIVIDIYESEDSAIMKGIAFRDVRVNTAFSPRVHDYSFADIVTGDTVKITVIPNEPFTTVTVDGKPILNNTESEISIKNKNTLTILATSESGQNTQKFVYKIRDTLEVQGKIVLINGKAVLTNLIPKVVNDKTLIPLKDTLKALGFSWTSSEDKNNVIVDRYGNQIQMQAIMVDGSPMLLLDEVGDFLHVQTSIHNPPQYTKRTVPETEKKAKAELTAAVKANAAAQTVYENANKKYQETFYSEPVFRVTGQIKSRKPFYLWGAAFSENAPLDHPGWAAAQSTNILIQNPDNSKIAYNNYIMGMHYYKGSTTAKGIYGQTVPVYIFGGPSASLQKKINAAKAVLDKASTALKKSKDAVEVKKRNLIQTVKSYYDSLQAKNPKDANTYLAYAQALVDTSVQLDETRDLLKLATQKSDKAKSLLPAIDYYFTLYLADQLEYGDRYEGYAKIASKHPDALLNYCETARQYLDAATVLEDEKHYSYAEYAYNILLTIGSDSQKAKAAKHLEDLAKVDGE
ncbi:cadherin-like beta sandwich domain-containing protein [Cohnella yongneupensis]|uniref:Cadherin-like beta sandwich domain-containing protein n=1 Tax=Cohnella yongneupensis TaxID=425006 RepID=A0ABW0QVQ5_9BACL